MCRLNKIGQNLPSHRREDGDKNRFIDLHLEDKCGVFLFPRLVSIALVAEIFDERFVFGVKV